MLIFSLNASHGGSTSCQFEHHMRKKFATPILHVIDNFKNYDIHFYIYNH